MNTTMTLVDFMNESFGADFANIKEASEETRKAEKDFRD